MPWGAIGGAAIGAIGSLIGGHMNNSASAANAAQQYANQKEFAQNGVRWKVADAQAAGIHPLAALGSQTFSYNPVMAGDSGNGVGEALARMGQGVERAYQAKQVAEDRELDKKVKEAQVDNINAQADAARAQAEASRAAVARTALPPAMPLANGKRMTNPEEGRILDKPIQMYGWAKDHKGRTMSIIPSDDMKSRTEDVLGVELLPWFSSAYRNIKAKYLGEPIDGMYWHGENIGFKPYPPKRKKGFFDHARDAMRFYAD